MVGFHYGGTAPIKFPLSVMKPVNAQWIKDLYKYISDHPDIMDFKAAGTTDVVLNE